MEVLGDNRLAKFTNLLQAEELRQSKIMNRSLKKIVNFRHALNNASDYEELGHLESNFSLDHEIRNIVKGHPDLVHYKAPAQIEADKLWYPDKFRVVE